MLLSGPCGVQETLRKPLRCWVSRNINPDKLAPSQPNNNQNIQLNKADGWNHKQIHRRNLRRMVAQKSAPALAGRIIATSNDGPANTGLPRRFLGYIR
jgi:hypothetical protein